MAMKTFGGVDPLGQPQAHELEHRTLLDRAQRQEIRNILKCYTGYYDLFSELLQNALDSTEHRQRRDGARYSPRISIYIDMSRDVVRVSDNGVGMSTDEFQFFLRPNVSFKEGEGLRGNKGVGATFLAYGYNHLKVHSRQRNDEACVLLQNGRKWAESEDGQVRKPTFEDADPFDDSIRSAESGTSFELRLYPGETPRLNYMAATSAEQWFHLLRIKTPLGGVYLHGEKYSVATDISVTDPSGNSTTYNSSRTEYYYPHEIPDLRAKSVREIRRAMHSIAGGLTELRKRLPGDFQRLEAVWEIWGPGDFDISDSETPLSLDLDEEQRFLVQRHKVHVYGFFCHSTAILDEFSDTTLRLRKGKRVLSGGLQLASDWMVQGELITIPLTKAIGHQNQAHVIVHFSEGEPDLGRKTFQPDKRELAIKLARKVVDELKKYRDLMKADTGAVYLAPKKELYDWIKDELEWKDSHPLSRIVGLPGVRMLSKPRTEQDVVALFHEMVGSGFFRGMDFYATRENKRYDSLFLLNYPDDSVLFTPTRCFGIDKSAVDHFPYLSEPKVLEYKWDLDALAADFSIDEKFPGDIDLVVAWHFSQKFSDRIELQSVLVSPNEGRRTIYGTTHRAFLAGDSSRPAFEVILLRDLFEYLEDPKATEIRQKEEYPS